MTANWFYHMTLSAVGFLVCSSILVITLAEKFTSGGWLTVLITSSVVVYCWIVKNHYIEVEKQVKYLDTLLTLPLTGSIRDVPALDPKKPTAIFLIGESTGQGMHTLLWVQRMFPGHFKNFIFMSVGVVDVGSYGSDKSLEKMKKTIEKRLQYFINFSKEHGFAATSMIEYGNDPIAQLTALSEQISQEYGNTVFFSASLISKQDNWFHRTLHSDVPILLQRYLHLRGLQMVILPVRLER